MKIIEWLSERIEDETEDARVYIETALMKKTEYPKLSDTLAKISEQEMQHMAMLHNEVVDIIEEFRKKNSEVPKEMMAVYEYLHKKQIEKSATVKAMQTQYRS